MPKTYSMVALRKALVFGVLVWLTAFVVAFLIFPLRESSRPVFESIMPVVLAAATVFFAVRYFRDVHDRFAREGLLLGLMWMGINLAIDLPLMLSPSPMQTTLADYVGDIGLTYFLIPTITTGIGLVRSQAEAVNSDRDAT